MKRKQEWFNITRVHRNDLIGLGFDGDAVDDAGELCYSAGAGRTDGPEAENGEGGCGEIRQGTCRNHGSSGRDHKD